jgi:hypothetical protein
MGVLPAQRSQKTVPDSQGQAYSQAQGSLKQSIPGLGHPSNLRSQLRGAGGISVTLDALPRLVVHVYRMGERLALSSNATPGTQRPPSS